MFRYVPSHEPIFARPWHTSDTQEGVILVDARNDGWGVYSSICRDHFSISSGLSMTGRDGDYLIEHGSLLGFMRRADFERQYQRSDDQS